MDYFVLNWSSFWNQSLAVHHGGLCVCSDCVCSGSCNGNHRGDSRVRRSWPEGVQLQHLHQALPVMRAWGESVLWALPEDSAPGHSFLSSSSFQNTIKYLLGTLLFSFTASDSLLFCLLHCLCLSFSYKLDFFRLLFLFILIRLLFPRCLLGRNFFFCNRKWFLIWESIHTGAINNHRGPLSVILEQDLTPKQTEPKPNMKSDLEAPHQQLKGLFTLRKLN